MNIFEMCFDGDGLDGYVELSIGGVHKQHRRLVSKAEIASFEPDYAIANQFFGVSLRIEPEPAVGKANIAGCRVCWVDIDGTDSPPPSVIPPTMIVASGHGFHYYWRLSGWIKKLEVIEQLNKAVIASIPHADTCQNADRIMRIPGTINSGKDNEQPTRCTVLEVHPERVYNPKSLYTATRLDDATVRRILTGDRRGFKDDSRSGRDWAIIRDLVQVGMPDTGIVAIFSQHACGDKYRDPGVNGDNYLRHTITQLRAKYPNGVPTNKRKRGGGGGKPQEIVEGEDGYYLEGDRGRRRLSTFVMSPTLLLEGETEDSIMVDIKAEGSGHTWNDVVVPISAFSSTGAFVRCLNRAAWVWLGRESDIRMLQMMLIRKIQEMGLPRAISTTVIGRHKIEDDDRTFFVGHDGVLASDGELYTPRESPIAYIDTGRDFPHVNISLYGDDLTPLLREMAGILPRINRPEVVWPLVGWFMAAPMKPAFEEYGYRFPILNVFGTRGSGKTTTILRVFHQLLGYVEERNYDANTTRFVMLSLLGSSNAVPIAFSEFRVASVADFARYILLAYDTGRDPRGRPDQTTVDYPLHAPFTVDGEDMVEDPATMERIIAVRMSPSTIEYGTRAHAAFERLQTLELDAFAGEYLLHTLKADVPALLDAAEQDMWDAYPESIPNRIRKNMEIVWLGITSLADFMRKHGVWCAPPKELGGARVLGEVLSNVYSTKLGRAPTEADSFVEVVVNAAARSIKSFPWALDGTSFWFQLTPAFEYYLNQRSRQRRATLTREAIRAQLLELIREYTLAPLVMTLGSKRVMAYGVNLVEAHEAGLDVPAKFSTKTFTFDLG